MAFATTGVDRPPPTREDRQRRERGWAAPGNVFPNSTYLSENYGSTSFYHTPGPTTPPTVTFRVSAAALSHRPVGAGVGDLQ
jgi:hypothetical protein